MLDTIQLLRQASTRVDRILDEIAAARQLTGRQAEILLAITDHPQTPQAALLDLLASIDRSTLYDVTRRLRRSGLVRYAATGSPHDAREVPLEATRDGALIAESIRHRVFGIDAILARRLSGCVPALRRIADLKTQEPS